MQKELYKKDNQDAVYQYVQQLKDNWGPALQSNSWPMQVAVTFSFLIPLYFFLVPYLKFIENRQGLMLNDFFLNHVPANDLSPLIFGLVYSCAGFIILYSIRSPWLLLRNIQVFIVLQYLRNLCLYMVPLAAPHGIVPLHDPILEYVAYDQKPLLQDLFFSGHTAAVVLFALFTKKNNYLFTAFVLISCLMAYLLIVQHCHYTIDIIGGVVFAMISYYLVNILWNRLYISDHLNLEKNK